MAMAAGIDFADSPAPNDRHQLGRQEAMSDAVNNGYEILNDGDETKVWLPGLKPRVYDFVVLDPVSRQQFGVEVKTSWLETIFLKNQQVDFDVKVASGKLGPATGLGGTITITGVQYYTYCFQCVSGEAQLRSYVLQERLELAGIRTYRGKRLSQ